MKSYTVDHPLVRSIDLFDQPKSGDPRQFVDYDYLSPSQLRSLASCGVKYYLHYVQHEPEPPAPALIKGSGVHGGLAHWQTARLNRIEVSVDDAVAAGLASIEEELAREGLTDEERAEIRKDVERGIPVAMRDFADTQPIAVERGCVIHWRDREVLPVLGYTDLLHRKSGGEVVRDWKTSSRALNEISARIDGGLTTYATAYRLILRRETIPVELAAIVFTKDAKTDIKTSLRGDRDTNRLYRKARVATLTLRAGLYMPADDAIVCGMCDFEKSCYGLLGDTLPTVISTGATNA